jgi:ATP-dependent Clp protease protease subunit
MEYVCLLLLYVNDIYTIYGMKQSKKNSKRKRQCNKSDSDSSDDDVCDDEDIKIFQNNIYFYTDVTTKNICKLNTSLDELNAKLKRKVDILGIDASKLNINLYINSNGGSLHAGLSGMDHISASKIPVTTIIDGSCDSAASFLSIAGHRRLIKKHAYVLIHQLSIDGFWGKFEEFKDEYKNCDMIMKTLVDIYTSKTKLTKKKITQLLSRELYLSSAEVIKYGFADDYFTR